jgi:hypothetical protein
LSSVKCAAAIGVDRSRDHVRRLRTTGAILGLTAAQGLGSAAAEDTGVVGAQECCSMSESMQQSPWVDLSVSLWEQKRIGPSLLEQCGIVTLVRGGQQSQRWNQSGGPDYRWMMIHSRKMMQRSRSTHSDDTGSVRVRIESSVQREGSDPTAVRCESLSELSSSGAFQTHQRVSTHRLKRALRPRVSAQ